MRMLALFALLSVSTAASANSNGVAKVGSPRAVRTALICSRPCCWAMVNAAAKVMRRLKDSARLNIEPHNLSARRTARLLVAPRRMLSA